MSANKVIGIVFWSALHAFASFCLMLYLALRIKVNDISDQLSFSAFIGKKTILGKDAILVTNYEHFVIEEPL